MKYFNFISLSEQVRSARDLSQQHQKNIEANLGERNKELSAISIKYFNPILQKALSEELLEQLALEIECEGRNSFRCTAKGNFNGVEYSFHLAEINDDIRGKHYGWEINYPRKNNWPGSVLCPFEQLEEELVAVFGKLQDTPATLPAEDSDDSDDCDCDCDCDCE